MPPFPPRPHAPPAAEAQRTARVSQPAAQAVAREAHHAPAGPPSHEALQQLADRSEQARQFKRLQAMADQRAEAASPGRTTVQRLRSSDSNTFMGGPQEPLTQPFFFVAGVVRHVDQHGIVFNGLEPEVLCVTMTYAQSTMIKYVEVTAKDVAEMRTMLRKRTPEVRALARQDADIRNDDHGDRNPSGFWNNCGYCVLASVLGIDSADQTIQYMAQVNLSDGDPHRWISLEHIQFALGVAGRGVSDIVAGLSKAELRAHICNHVSSDDSEFIVYLPSHFVIARWHDDQNIQIEDPQTNESWDFKFLPEASFAVFSVDD